MIAIEDAVNVGLVLAGDLRRAGIATLEQLRDLGHRQAWLRLHAVAPERDGAHSGLALAGAIHGDRWHTILAAERAAILAHIASRPRS